MSTPDLPDDPRIQRARAMRLEGCETAEIARACGVGVSTIYRWAELYRFRVKDLDAAALADPAPEAPVNGCEAETQGDGSAAREALPASSPHALKAAAEQALQSAMTLSARGRMRAAEQALRLAERFTRLEQARADTDLDADADAEAAEAEHAALRAELEGRMEQLITHISALPDPDAFEPRSVMENVVFHGLRDPECDTLTLPELIARYR